LQSIKKNKDVLTDLLGIKEKEALVRSRFQNLNKMDAPTRFFGVFGPTKEWSKQTN